MGKSFDNFTEMSETDQFNVEGGVVTLLAVIGISAVSTLAGCVVLDVADSICENATGKDLVDCISDWVKDVFD